ncbi:MAG TPA: hypothetical protein VHM88_02745, partial [Candidatus Acidoferrales bacterium]|nr:hypothetical protein [Candidatus Acidoferrales bacterium]
MSAVKEHRKAGTWQAMLRADQKLSNRERDFLHWLLDPKLFAERVPRPPRNDQRKVKRAVALLERLPPTEKRGMVCNAISDLNCVLESWNRTVFQSPIQSESRMGTENMETSRRLFLATLIARKRGPKPYEFLFAKFDKPWFDSPKAIEMRVRRFESRLEPQGPISCQIIISFKYSQFVTIRRWQRLKRILFRYQAKKLTYEEYSKQCTRLMMPNPQEIRWLDSLCRHARPRSR